MTQPDEQPGNVQKLEYIPGSEIGVSETLRPGSAEKVNYPNGIPGTELSSGAAIIGQVLKADGVGGTYWGTDASGVFIVGPQGALYGNDQTGYYRGAYAIDIQTGRTSAFSTASGDHSIVIGYNSFAFQSHEAISIGISSWLEGRTYRSIAVGYRPHVYSRSYDTICMGSYSEIRAYSPDAIALGHNAYVDGESSIAIGYSSYADGNGALAAGNNAYVNGLSGIAIGENSNVTGLINAIAMGVYARASGNRSIAQGNNADATGSGAIAIGNVATSGGDSAVAIGSNSSTGANYSGAIGYNAQSNYASAFAIGPNVVTRAINTVRIGADNTKPIEVDSNTAAGQTNFWLFDHDNNTLERVTVGAADSGGAGYKVLRIPN